MGWLGGVGLGSKGPCGVGLMNSARCRPFHCGPPARSAVSMHCCASALLLVMLASSVGKGSASCSSTAVGWGPVRSSGMWWIVGVVGEGTQRASCRQWSRLAT